MGEGLEFTLERPVALLLLGLIPIFAILAWRRRAAIGTVRASVAITIRGLLIALLALSLAQPTAKRQGEGVSTMVVVDVSESVPLELQEAAFKVVEEALATRERPIDRLGLVTAGRDAVTLSMPSTAPGNLDDVGITERDATDLEGAVRRSLALLPPDTSHRLLLVSDGNETTGSLREAAMAARAAGVPIDVIPLEYRRDAEVVLESVQAPARGRVGQPVDLKVVVKSPKETSGKLFLWQDSVQVDLSPSDAGDGVAVRLDPGSNTIRLPVELFHAGASRYRVSFVPVEGSGDALVQNNSGEAIVFAGGEGRVLIIDPSIGQGGAESAIVARALRAAQIGVDIADPSSLNDPLALASYDAVILANVARFDISNQLDRALKSYVADLGGGLWMLGGDHAFGAGGWIGSEAAAVLPVKMDPPATRELPRGALALIMHSCELPEGNYWAEKIALAAIETLSAQDYLGIVSFAWNNAGSGSSWQYPMQLAGDKVKARVVARTMSVGDMPDFESSLKLAYEGLMGVKAGQRHIIIISDGDPSPPQQLLLDSCRAEGISITTVMVAGHGTATDLQNMRAVAEQTGGTFHNVINPKLLPKVVTKEATMVSRSLIVEGDFQPTVLQSNSGPMTGLSTVPPIQGYVVTVPRGGLAEIGVLNMAADARRPGSSYDDPIFAWWNHGTGRAAALTTDLAGRWGAAWASWSGLQGFVERTVRWLMRPPSPQDVAMRMTLEGESIQIEIETGTGESRVAGRTATILRPDGTAEAVRLEQVAPGRWHGEHPVSARGAYLVQVPLVGPAGGGGGVLHAAVSSPYPREYLATRDNAPLLREVAELTGGRVLSLQGAASSNLFLAEGLKIPTAQRRIWDLLALIAAIALIIDIAARRLVFDRSGATSLAQRVVGATASGSRGGLDALRRVREGEATRDVGAETSTPATTAMPRKDPGSRRTASAAPASVASPSDGESAHRRDEAVTGTESEPTDGASDASLSPLERLRRARERARREVDDGQ
ncbi:MAG: hypothetical protein O2819_02550 [Planctomycetota bacterium]|nr:hypothetical protein [Planctomycetota bacterium]MDA1105800.1 hypothetical protein [Planctomycetota bacterium]